MGNVSSTGKSRMLNDGERKVIIEYVKKYGNAETATPNYKESTRRLVEKEATLFGPDTQRGALTRQQVRVSALQNVVNATKQRRCNTLEAVRSLVL